MTILVTGATGMLGQKIMAEAECRGLDALGLARHNADINLDITDDEALGLVFETHQPSLMVNCAAIIDIGLCEMEQAAAYRLNARAVSVMAGLCRGHGAKLVQISTEHYFSGDGQALHDEVAEVNLLHEYARTKFAGEAFALVNSDSLVLRTNIVGFRGWKQPTLLEWAIGLARNDSEAVLFEDSYVSSIDTLTCAKVIFDLIERGANGVVNVGSREVFSKATFIRAIAEGIGEPLTKAKNGSVKSLNVIRAESLGLNVSKAEGLLGYDLPTLAEVVETLVRECK